MTIPDLGPNIDPILYVKPQALAGWTTTKTMRELRKPVTLWGTNYTSGEAQIRYKGSLPDEEFQIFGILFQLPKFEEDTVLRFNVTQVCESGGQNLWIDEDHAADERTGNNTRIGPAPILKVSAVDGDLVNGDEHD